MKKIILLFITISSIFISCGEPKKISIKKTQQEILLHKSANELNIALLKKKDSENKAIDKFINNLSLQEKICQLFIVNIDGNRKFTPIEKMSMICPEDDSFVVPGGCLLFGFNLADTAEGVIEFTDSIAEYCINNRITPPFLAVDQEGGKVNRLKKISGTYPSAQEVAETFSLDDAKKLFNFQSKQMEALGIHLNLAPVTEVCTEFNKSFLDGRSYGSLENVLLYGKQNVNSFENNKVGTVLKHFPGNSNTDPHSGLPEIDLTEKELFDSLKSFEELIKEKPSGILMSHARTTAIDNDKPACLSSFWVTDVLRNKYKYNGIIFSDDIFMGALAKNNYPPEKAVLMAIDAGIDSIMISEKRFASAAKVLYDKAIEDPLFRNKIDESVKRIVNFKLKKNILCFSVDEESDDLCYEIKPVIPESFDKRVKQFYDAKKENNNLFLGK